MHLTFYKDIIFITIIIFSCCLNFYYYQKMVHFKRILKKKRFEMGRLRKSLNLYKNLHKFDHIENNININDEFLNDRQREVLKLIVKGYTNNEMADRLFIAPTTIKYHVRNIYKIYNVRDRAQLFEKISVDKMENQAVS